MAVHKIKFPPLFMTLGTVIDRTKYCNLELKATVLLMKLQLKKPKKLHSDEY